MEHLKLEIFDLATKDNPRPTGSQYAVLEENASIPITDTSEIFASGDVWSHSFTLNVHANAHIFGTSGDLHGSRLHEQINKRRARLWVDGLPLYLGYLKLDEEVDVDNEGNVDVGFESGKKTFDEMIEGTSATEVSVGDVVIGVALNRKRVVQFDYQAVFTLDGLKAYANKNEWLNGIDTCLFSYWYSMGPSSRNNTTPYTQRWPKLVKSHGEVLDSTGQRTGDKQDDDGNAIVDYTNVQIPYDGTNEHSFCNINICYPFKSVDAEGNEVAGRGYTTRLAHGKPTVDGGDNQTRYNNAPNFYLLYFIDRLFKDLGILITENQALDVGDLRRVFMLNYGCHYEEIENENDYYHSIDHDTPQSLRARYGQYYLPLIDETNQGKILKKRLVNSWRLAGKAIYTDDDVRGKVLMRDVEVRKDGVSDVLNVSSVEGKAIGPRKNMRGDGYEDFSASLQKYTIESNNNAYSAYLAYATGDNYPHVEISEIVKAMESMFGIRLLFNNDYSTVRLVLLRNIFRSNEIQEINCDILNNDEKVENSIRGFRMTYGKGKDNTSFYYKGFADLFPRASTTWKDTSDKHDYSQWDVNAIYDEIKQYVSAFNRKCYVTPVNGNAYGTQVDEDEDVLFPSLLEWAGFMDAEDGDCSKPESEGKTIEEVQCGATPVIMNEVGTVYASLFSGDMKAPTPETPTDFDSSQNTEHPSLGQKIATFGRATKISYDISNERRPGPDGVYFTLSGKFDLYISEGFQIRMEDNYAISNGGTPFDEIDPGLCFGIMRSSGNDASIRYYDDPDDDEDNNVNDAWEVVPGSGAVSHPDTCDSYGNMWDYNGNQPGISSATVISTPAQAIAKLAELWPNSHAPFYDNSKGYLTYAYGELVLSSDDGKYHHVLFASNYSNDGEVLWADFYEYLSHLQGKSIAGILEADTEGYNGLRNLIIEIDTSYGRANTLLSLCRIAYGGSSEILYLNDDGEDSRYGRFSLKLRAEKLNPYYEEGSSDPDKKDRYLSISNPDLRQRGLADQFYKEYSYWVRNARILKRTVHMTLAQLLSIDKTKKVRVGDVTGFIRKMQYSVSNKTGLGEVTMEIMYI